MSEETCRYTLITNLDYVSVNEVRTNTMALLLEDTPSWQDKTVRELRIRGFGADPAWPIFDMRLPSLEYTLTPFRSAATIITSVEGEEGLQMKPLFTGGTLQIEGGPAFQLCAEDGSKPIDFMTFSGENMGETISEVWEALTKKVFEYWKAPNFPVLRYERMEVLRIIRRQSC